MRLNLIHLLLGCGTLALILPRALGHEEYSVQIERLSGEIATRPADAALYVRRGELLGECGSLELAQADFRKCRQLDPSKIETYFLEGTMLLKTDRFEDAADALTKFLSFRPDDPGARLYLARAEAGLGQRAQAEQAYREALAQLTAPKPDDYVEWANYILADAGHDRRHDALAALDAGVARLGLIVTLQLAAVDLERDLGLEDAAIARLDTIMTQAARKEAWNAQKAEILMEAGRTREAQLAAKAALEEIESLPPGRKRAPAVAARQARMHALLENEFMESQIATGWATYR